MKTLNYFTKLTFTLLLTIAIITAGCDNPAGSDGNDEDHEHTEPLGLELILNGETVIEYFNGNVTGDLHVTEGEETALITIEFLNEEGENIHEEISMTNTALVGISKTRMFSA